MRYTSCFLFVIGCLFQVILISCATGKHDKNGVESAMKQYDRLLQKMDPDSISLLYTKDGDLGNMAHGRDSIRKFLSGFKNITVLSQSSTTESIQISADTAFQKGMYYQKDVIGKDTIAIKGTYTATWLWETQNGWLIKRMETKPVK
jgi:ketosteroid isomerase-like protein